MSSSAIKRALNPDRQLSLQPQHSKTIIAVSCPYEPLRRGGSGQADIVRQ
jgi:hypothetical protein